MSRCLDRFRHRYRSGADCRYRLRYGQGLAVVQTPLAKRDVHAEAGANFDQERDEDGHRHLHLLQIKPGNLRQHRGLRVCFRHHCAVPEVFLEFDFHGSDARFQRLGFRAGRQFSYETVILLTERTTFRTSNGRTAVRVAPSFRGLGLVNFTLHRRLRTMLRDPAELFLRSLQFSPQVLVVIRSQRALPGGIEPVESRMSETRRQRVRCDDDPNNG